MYLSRLAFLLAIPAMALPPGGTPKAASRVSRPAPLANSLGMTFASIPPGSFFMGSASHEGPCPACAGKAAAACPSCKGKGTATLPDGEAWPSELPRHPVTVPRGFLLQTRETTRGQWKAVMGSEPWSRFDLFLKQGDDFAATFVSWEEIGTFITRLEAKDPTHTYRLPTEAEWEYACRAGGDGPRYGAVGDVAWYVTNALEGGEKYTHQVGLKAPNAWGLYDMLGNVWEWCQDTWTPDHQGSHGMGPRLDGDPARRVLRGGSWRSEAGRARAAARNHMDAKQFSGDLGFRLVMEARRPSR